MSVPLVPALAVTRSAIGASAWIAPVLACKLFGTDISAERNANFILRMAGSRDFALAAAPLVTGTEGRRAALQIAAACDIADLTAIAIARRSGKLSTLSAVLFAAASAGCLAAGIKALSETP